MTTVFASAAFASGGAEHDPHAIPWNTIGIQAFNFSVFLGIVIYFGRQKIASAFADRFAAFNESRLRAEKERQEAEDKFKKLRADFSVLTDRADADERRAQQEAQALVEKTVADAKAQAKRMVEEARRTEQLEMEKANARIRLEILESALEEGKRNLEKLDKAEQKRLQGEFVEKIQVVR